MAEYVRGPVIVQVEVAIACVVHKISCNILGTSERPVAVAMVTARDEWSAA